MNRYIFIFLLIIFYSCKNRDAAYVNPKKDTSAIILSADEAFRPAIEEQLKVFQALHPGRKIAVEYKPEAECWNDLYRNEVGMVIVSKNLSASEAAYFYDSLRLYPQNHLLAYDAIALVLSRQSRDSVFTVEQVSEILNGKSSLPYRAVFDGKKATGSVRFAVDSILQGKTKDLRLNALSSSMEVIRYVSDHSDAMGFVGISWIGHPEDPEQIEHRKNVRLAWLPCRGCKDSSYSYPVQEEIYYRRYPFTRAIYAIVKERELGRASEFVNFMKGDQGQLLFRRMYLVPAKRPFIVRETIMNTKMP
jgi:phosphate transport system substrate-binding protein